MGRKDAGEQKLGYGLEREEGAREAGVDKNLGRHESQTSSIIWIIIT